LNLLGFIKYLLFVIIIISSVSAQAIDAFYNQRAIKIAVNKASFPYHFKNDKSQAAGIMVDFWRLWAKKQNVAVEFVIVDWSETIQHVKNRSLDIHAGLSITAEVF